MRNTCATSRSCEDVVEKAAASIKKDLKRQRSVKSFFREEVEMCPLTGERGAQVWVSGYVLPLSRWRLPDQVKDSVIELPHLTVGPSTQVAPWQIEVTIHLYI